MKKAYVVLCILFIFISCGQKQEKVEIISEDGVDVVLNHIEPYQIRGEKTSLILEDEMTIDFGSDEIGELGVANATQFCVDSDGYIYFCENNKDGNLIFKFTPDGRFEKSFGPKGQGPGDIQFAMKMRFDSKGQLVVSDLSNRKILTFSRDGQFMDEIRHPKLDASITVLRNGNYLYLRNKRVDSNEFSFWELVLLNSQMEEVKVLDTQKEFDPDFNNFRGVNSRAYFKWETDDEAVYVMSEDRGYEFLKFDLNGKLIRKIRKKYYPISVSDETIKTRKEMYQKSGIKAWFPKHWLPICDFFIDEEGWIYAMTFERGENPKEYIYNIFNSEGVYVADVELEICFYGDRMVCAQINNNRLYYFKLKSDEFREFKVSRMRWE